MESTISLCLLESCASVGDAQRRQFFFGDWYAPKDGYFEPTAGPGFGCELDDPQADALLVCGCAMPSSAWGSRRSVRESVSIGWVLC
jgi:hypothetical protein